VSACGRVKKAITESFAVPIEKFVTRFQEVCEEAKKQIEEKFERPVEEWVSRQERKCRELPWWNPLRWFCEIVMVVVKVVTWVVTTVVKWVVYLVCKVVAFVVKVITSIVILVVRWVVTFVVCLFSEPLQALASFRDLWTGVLDIVDDVVDFVGSLLGDVNDLLGDVESLIDTVGAMLGPIGIFFAGLFKWVIGVVRSAIDIVRGLLDAVKDIVLGILRLDWCRLGGGLANLGVGLGRVVILVPRAFFLGIAGGERDAFNQSTVEGIVDAALVRAFDGDPIGLEAARDKVMIGHRPFGAPFHIDARRMFLNSRSGTVDLAALHREGVIDLASAARLWTRCPETGPLKRPRWEVVYAGTNTRVDWGDISRFLDEGPDSVAEFRVYAITRDVLVRDLETAARKAQQVGVQFTWGIGDYEITNRDEIPLADTDVGNETALRRAGRVGAVGTPPANGDDMCRPPAINVFRYVNADRNGLTSETRLPSIRPSGVTFKDRLPEWGFIWVLIHELGHYLGLDHDGHEGIQHIMYTADPSAGLTWFTAGTIPEYVILEGEPRFTLDDARRVWEWIPVNARPCLR